jgi:hypothetical protein
MDFFERHRAFHEAQGLGHLVEYRWLNAGNLGTNHSCLVGFSPGAFNSDPGNRDLSATMPFSTQSDVFSLGQDAARPAKLLARVQKLEKTLPAGTTINGIDMTITLPAGVTVKADAVSGAADPTILVLSGAAAALPNTIVSGKYDKTANTLHVIIANVQPGFAAGEFMRVNFDGFPAGTATFAVVLNQVSGGVDPKATPATLTGVTATSDFAGR